MQELWQPVVGWETRYEVSNLGRVRSLPYYASNPKGPGIHQREGRVLKPQLQRDGYLLVILRDKGRNSGRTVHSLVAECFLPPCPGKVGRERGCWQVHHSDENKVNNSAQNLQWLPRDENNRLSRTALKEVDIKEIRQRRADGASLQELASEYKKSIAGISMICSRKTWGWVA